MDVEWRCSWLGARHKQANRSVYVTSRVWQAATPMSLPLVADVLVIIALRDELEVLLDLAPGGQADGRRTKHLWLSLPPPSVSASWHARCFPLIHRWHRRGLTAQMSVQTLSVSLHSVSQIIRYPSIVAHLCSALHLHSQGRWLPQTRLQWQESGAILGPQREEESFCALRVPILLNKGIVLGS